MTFSRALFRATVVFTVSATALSTLSVVGARAEPSSPRPEAVAQSPRNASDLSQSVVSSRKARSTDYLNPDGSHTAVLADHSVNYLAPDATYQPIDSSLVPDAELSGGLINSANSWRVHFASTTYGVTFDTASGSVGMTPQGSAAVVPTKTGDGTSVRYPNAWANADLDYTVVDTGVKESVMLKGPGAGTSFSFAIRTGTKSQLLGRKDAGVVPTMRRLADGSVSGDGPMSAVNFATPMVLRADGEPMEGAHAKLTASAGRIVLSLDPAWLAKQPTSAFPINLDPSIFVDYNSSYSYKTDGFSCHNCGVQFGNARDGGDTEWRTVAHYPYESLFGDEILGAELDTGWQAGTKNAYTTRVYWASAYSFYGATGHPTVLASGTPGGTTGTLAGAGLTSQIKSWADTRTSGGAFGFVGTETAGLYTYQSYNIKLYVLYDAPPSAPTNVKFNRASPSIPTVCGNSSNTIDGSQPSSWKATINAPTTRALTANFLWWDAAMPSVTHSVPSLTFLTGSANTLAWVKSWNQNQFQDAHTYYWKVQGTDGLKSGPWSATCVFHVSDPVATAPTSPGFGAASPGLPCGSAVRGDQAVVLHANIKNPGPAGQQIRAEFTVSYAGATPHTYLTPYTTASTQLAQVTVSANTVAGQFSIPNNTAFTWTVATRTQSDNKLSPVSNCDGTTSSGAQLSGPVVTAESALANGTATVLDSRTITFTDAASDPTTGVQRYAYSFSDDLPDLASTPCGTFADVSMGPIYGLVCSTDEPDAAGNPWNTVSVVVPSTAFSIYVWAIDATGTVSPMTTATFTAADVTGGVESHLWQTDSQDTVNSPNTVADVIPDNSLPLGITANTTAPHWTSGTDGAPWASPGSNGTAMHFDGAAGWSGTGTGNPAVPLNTSNNQWDSTDNFSVQAWVRPTVSSPSTGWNVAMSQDGGSVSGFMLGQSNGNWVFCMPTSQVQTTGYDGDCATLPQQTGYVNSWALLTGVWDASSRKITLYVSDALNDPATPAPRSATLTHADSAQAYEEFAVGRGEWGGSNAYFWQGDIEDPTVWLGLVSADQIASMAANGPYNPNNQ